MRQLLSAILIVQVIALMLPPMVVRGEFGMATSTLAVDSGTSDGTIGDPSFDAVNILENEGLENESQSSAESDDLAGNGVFLEQALSAGDIADENASVAETEAIFIEKENVGQAINNENDGVIEPGKNAVIFEDLDNASSTAGSVESGSEQVEAVSGAVPGIEMHLAAGVSATSTMEHAPTSTIATVGGEDPKESRVIAQWVVGEDGQVVGEIAPSGNYGVESNFKLCGAVEDVASAGLDGIYGQIFYPRNAGFGENDKWGRVGCGQMTGAVCKMEKIARDEANKIACSGDAAFDGAFFFVKDKSIGAVCSDNGEVTGENIDIYCCDRSLAYDDVAGIYETMVISKGADGSYSNALAGAFKFAAKASFETDFGAVDYGSVAESRETAAESYGGAIKPLIRNTGNTRIKISLSQDDMGLTDSTGAVFVSYRAGLGDSGDTVSYLPFELAAIPGMIDLSTAMPLRFAVFVSEYPGGTLAVSDQYIGQMLINAEDAGNYSCADYALNKELPDEIDIVADNSEWETAAAIVKDEATAVSDEEQIK